MWGDGRQLLLLPQLLQCNDWFWIEIFPFLHCNIATPGGSEWRPSSSFLCRDEPLASRRLRVTTGDSLCLPPFHSWHKSSTVSTRHLNAAHGFGWFRPLVRSLNAAHSGGRPPYSARLSYHNTPYCGSVGESRVSSGARRRGTTGKGHPPTVATVRDGQCSSLKENVCLSADDFIHTY